ncbi:MAG: MFS transporter, partial [Sciscionella sp.]|nr:MFS transporter [Sciscionella sp.]
MIGLLRQRDFRLLWVGETTSKLGSAVTMVALPLVAVISLHANTFTVSALEAAAWLPWLLIGLPAGAWVDRLPRRAVMITCDVLSAVLFASVPIAAWLGWLSIGQLLAVALLTGVCTVFFQTSYQVYLPTVVRESELTEANAKLLGSESAGQVVGPGLGGLLAQLFGAVFGLLVDALSFVVSAFCLLRIRASEALPAKEKRAPLHREIGEGLRFVFHDPYLRTLVIYAGASNLVSNGFMAVMVPFLVRDIGLAPGLV